VKRARALAFDLCPSINAMRNPIHFPGQNRLRALLLCLSLFASTALAQEQNQQSPAQADDVIRISTDLIQTDVMVFDRQGKFVDGMKPEQFELRVDGKPQAISFFERITAGSTDEDAQIAAARGGLRLSSQGGQSATTTVRPLDRGRVIFFYLDDLHMAGDSTGRTRDSVTRFIENELGQNDQAAIITASGQLGILQQLTSEKFVLLTALKRLNPRAYNVTDNDRTPMTEHQALAVLRNDRSVIDYYVGQLSKEQNLPVRRAARTTQPARGDNTTNARLEQAVVGRARTIMDQSNAVTQSSLTGLEKLIRSVAPIPGRKLLFFISDGFYLNEQTSQSNQTLPRITDAAARSGIVIYSLEAHGLVAGLTPASERAPVDLLARVQVVDTAAVTDAQQPLYQIAAETGGRALLDTNALAPGLSQAVNETSAYYLLAWRPESVEHGGGKFQHLEVGVKGRNDLTVRVRSGFLSETVAVAGKRDSSKSKPGKLSLEDTDLLTAIHALYPKHSLPTSLSIGYTNTAEAGMMLTTSVQVDSSVLGINTAGGAQKTDVDVVGVLINDQGKPVSDFKQRLTIDPTRMTAAQQRSLVYSQQARITPGLYQVRVAARDSKSGRTGSAASWVEVPDITHGGLSVGSLFIGEMLKDTETAGAAPQQALINVNRRFSRASRLLFQTFVYNATRTAMAPDVALQVQIFRDDQPVITVPIRKLSTEGIADLTRIPYEDDFALDQLPAGRYVMQVTAIDRVAKTSASQRISFEIE
jgi:VWFA-related protein